MDIPLQRKQDLERLLKEDYATLAQLEGQKRITLSDPFLQLKFESEIKGIRELIAARQSELNSFNNVLDTRLKAIVQLYLAASFARDERAELDQAGEIDPERSTLLEQVFIDLEVKTRQGPQPRGYEIAQMEKAKAFSGQPPPETGSPSAMQCLLENYWNKIVIIGGPGQGKSTLGQQLSQVHRAALLGKKLEFQPQTARIPFRVILKYFAQWLTEEKDSDNLEDYLAEIVQKLSARKDVTAEDIQTIFNRRPCVLILDGLDEVIVPALRERMLSRIREFLLRVEQIGSDLLVMATSRPVTYEYQFDPDQFWHLELQPLSDAKITAYAQKWVQAKKLVEEEQARVLAIVKECQQDRSLSALLKTPLQVTIILLIAKDRGRPPSQREALFAQYWRTIFGRETSKAKGIIQCDESTLFDLHTYLGYVLHRRAAEENVQSLLPEEDFRKAIRDFLRKGDTRSPDSAIEQKIDVLVKDANERLVLLVEPQPGLFGFELRSFQEFFAAVHLVQTAAHTEQRFNRLKVIARSKHWRNVSLLFCGRVARTSKGEALSILELGCRPVDREGVNRYLQPGAWLALEVAADGALGVNRDLQYAAIEYGLKVLEKGLSPEEEGGLSGLLERLSDEDRSDLLRPILEEQLRSLPNNCLEPALKLYGKYFGPTSLFREKIDSLLESQDEDLHSSALNIAVTYEPDPAWMSERLKPRLSLVKSALSRWWSRSDLYVESLLTAWAPTESELTELGQGITRSRSFKFGWNTYLSRHVGYEIFVPDEITPLDQLILMLRLPKIDSYKLVRLRVNEIKFGDLAAISILPAGRFSSRESRYQFSSSRGPTSEIEILLNYPHLTAWFRARLWGAFWEVNALDDENLSVFVKQIDSYPQLEKLITEGYQSLVVRLNWPLLSLALETKNNGDPDALKRMLPLLNIDNQVSIGKQIKDTITELAGQSNEPRQRSFFAAVILEKGLDEFFPQLVPIAKQMGVSVRDIVESYTFGKSYVEFTADQLQEALTITERCLDDVNRLSALLYTLTNASWIYTEEVLTQLRITLELIIKRLQGGNNSFLARLASAFFLRLSSYDAGSQELAPRLFKLLSLNRSFLLNSRGISMSLRGANLPQDRISEWRLCLSDEDKDIRLGAAMFLSAVYNANESDSNSPSYLEEIRNTPALVEIALALIDDSDSKRRIIGITMLQIPYYPVEDIKYQQLLGSAIKQARNNSEAQAWDNLLTVMPMPEAKLLEWLSVLEKILDEPQSYYRPVLLSAMGRYQKLTSGRGISISQVEEQELGLP